jgi:hypothetical protein
MQFFPEPNFGPSLFNGSNNFSGTTRTNTDDHQGFLRIDYNIGAKDHLFGRYGVENVEGFAAPVNPNVYFGQHQPKRQQNAVLTYIRILSPSMINDFTVSYNRDLFKTLDAISGTSLNIARDLLIPGLADDPFTTGFRASRSRVLPGSAMLRRTPSGMRTGAWRIPSRSTVAHTG